MLQRAARGWPKCALLHPEPDVPGTSAAVKMHCWAKGQGSPCLLMGLSLAENANKMKIPKCKSFGKCSWIFPGVQCSAEQCGRTCRETACRATVQTQCFLSWEQVCKDSLSPPCIALLMLQGLAAAEAVCPQGSIQLPWLIGFAFSCREHPYLQHQKCMDTHWTSEHSHFPLRHCPSATECKGEVLFGIEGGWGLRFLLCSDEDWPALQEVQ